MPSRVTRIDLALDVLGERAEAGPHVVVDVGAQVGESIVEHLLPQGGLFQRVQRVPLASLQVVGKSVSKPRIVDDREL